MADLPQHRWVYDGNVVQRDGVRFFEYRCGKCGMKTLSGEVFSKELLEKCGGKK